MRGSFIERDTELGFTAVNRPKYYVYSLDGDPVLHTDASVTDGTTRMRIGADGHGLWVGTADAGAAAFHADPGEAVPLISTLASLVRPKAQRLRIAFGTVQPGATATFTYTLTPD